MANFNWICRECSIYWDRDYAIGKAPERTKCPKCKKLSHRYYLKENIGVSFCDDKDFHTVRRRYQKHAQKGFDKDSANRWYRNNIQASKDAMDEGHAHYEPMIFRPDKMAEKGRARKLNDKEVSEKIETAKNLTASTYDKAGLDPTKNDPANKQY